MKAKIKKQNSDGIVRLETSGEVREVLVHENMLNPNLEHIDICFRGRDSSGIIQFTTAEFEDICKSVSKRTHLIKGMKILKNE